MTQWRVLNRLRAIAEHGGMTKSSDRRLTTHNVRQTWLAVSGSCPTTPAGTSPTTSTWSAVAQPTRLSPRIGAAGYVTEGITFKNYLELWRAATTPAVNASERDNINF